MEVARALFEFRGSRPQVVLPLRSLSLFHLRLSTNAIFTSPQLPHLDGCVPSITVSLIPAPTNAQWGVPHQPHPSATCVSLGAQ